MGSTVVQRRSFVQKMKSQLRRWLSSQCGAASIEYAVMLGLIGTVSVSAISSLGTSARQVFQQVKDGIQRGSEEEPQGGSVQQPQPESVSLPPGEQ